MNISRRYPESWKKIIITGVFDNLSWLKWSLKMHIKYLNTESSNLKLYRATLPTVGVIGRITDDVILRENRSPSLF